MRKSRKVKVGEKEWGDKSKKSLFALVIFLSFFLRYILNHSIRAKEVNVSVRFLYLSGCMSEVK